MALPIHKRAVNSARSYSHYQRVKWVQTPSAYYHWPCMYHTKNWTTNTGDMFTLMHTYGSRPVNNQKEGRGLLEGMSDWGCWGGVPAKWTKENTMKLEVNNKHGYWKRERERECVCVCVCLFLVFSKAASSSYFILILVGNLPTFLPWTCCLVT